MALLKPGLFETFDLHKDYLSLIIKDVKNGVDKYNGAFVIAQGYSFEKSKGDVFILTDGGSWGDVEKKMKKKAKSFGSGECRIVKHDGGIKVAIKSSSGINAKDAIKTITKLLKSKKIEGMEFAAYLAQKSHDEAGTGIKITPKIQIQLAEVTVETKEYQKFDSAFKKFIKKYDISADGKLPVGIWTSLILGLIKGTKDIGGDLLEVGEKDQSTGRLLLAIKSKKGQLIRNEALQKAMDGLNKFVDHASQYLDKVVAKAKKGDTWAFWSGTGAQDMARKSGKGIVLEGTVGSWFDEIWNFSKMTGVSNFQLWTALSELYAKKAADNYENFKFIGYVGPGATTEQNVFNKIESPTFVEVLDKKQGVKAPPIEWYVVKCTETAPDSGKWALDESPPGKGIDSTHKDRGAALNRVKELYKK